MKKHQIQPVRRSNRVTKKSQENDIPANSTDHNKKIILFPIYPLIQNRKIKEKKL